MRRAILGILAVSAVLAPALLRSLVDPGPSRPPNPLCESPTSQPVTPDDSRLAHPSAAGLPLVFAENRGQFGASVRHRTVASIQLATLTDEGLVLTLLAKTASSVDAPRVGHNVRLRFGSTAAGRTVEVPPTGSQRASTSCSWFLGNDPSRWVADAPTWSAVRYHDVVPGVDVEVHGRSSRLEYDVLAEAGASIEDLVVVVEGAEEVRLGVGGTVELVTPLGTIRQRPAHTWEIGSDGSKHPLACATRVMGPDRFGFEVSGRNASRALLVDPEITYGTFVEGSGLESGWGIAVDELGAAYVVGKSNSVDFPVTPGAFDVTPPGFNLDVVVLKLGPDGSGLLYATYLGGVLNDQPTAVHVDRFGVATVVGSTESINFPTTPGAWSATRLGQLDAFVTRLNSSGTALVYSTYFGGMGTDDCFDLAVDDQGRPVFGGYTSSSGLPVTANALQPTPVLITYGNGFLARLSADGSSVDYCTYIRSNSGGGTAHAVGVDSAGAMYAGGIVKSASGFPYTHPVFQPFFAGGASDSYLLKLKSDGTLAWGTLIGGADTDYLLDLAVDHLGRVHACGWTTSGNFPTTPGAVSRAGTLQDSWIAKFAVDGSSLIYGTLLGGRADDFAASIAVGPSGDDYVVGTTASPNFPVTPDALDGFVGQFDAFLAKISADGTKLLYGTLLGGAEGTGMTAGWAVAVDTLGHPILTGFTKSPDFQVTPAAFDPELSSSDGIFVAKLDLSPWSNVGPGVAGTGGLVPVLSGSGTLQPLSPGALQLVDARPLSNCWFIVGPSQLSAPFKGGTLVPSPSLILPFVSTAQGSLTLPWAAWPLGAPAGAKLWFQVWIADPVAPVGFAASNGLMAVMPVHAQ